MAKLTNDTIIDTSLVVTGTLSATKLDYANLSGKYRHNVIMYGCYTSSGSPRGYFGISFSFINTYGTSYNPDALKPDEEGEWTWTITISEFQKLMEAVATAGFTNSLNYLPVNGWITSGTSTVNQDDGFIDKYTSNGLLAYGLHVASGNSSTYTIMVGPIDISPYAHTITLTRSICIPEVCIDYVERLE